MKENIKSWISFLVNGFAGAFVVYKLLDPFTERSYDELVVLVVAFGACAVSEIIVHAVRFDSGPLRFLGFGLDFAIPFGAIFWALPQVGVAVSSYDRLLTAFAVGLTSVTVTLVIALPGMIWGAIKARRKKSSPPAQGQGGQGAQKGP